MIEIQNTLISEDLLETEFVCNLSKCGGACCVEGDVGAPLLEEEVDLLKDLYPKVKPYMRKEGIEAIEAQGTHVYDEHDPVTPLVNNRECAYVYFEDQMAKCAIEKAYLDGEIDYKKPVSCHLYPLRITKYSSFEAINYHKWSICSDACSLGQELKVPVYQFLKEPLIRNYGKSWYEELEEVAKHWKGYS